MEKRDLKPIQLWTSPFLISSSGQTIGLQVNDHSKVDVELFSYLEYLAEVKEKGLERIRNIKKSNATNKNWLLFQSFIRQAKLYYFSAVNQDPAISSLNFFYSFENLVKAYCSLYYPRKFLGKIDHGIGTGKSFTQVTIQEISLSSETSVMSIFYKLITRKKIERGTKIEAKKILAYCSDIFAEYQRCVSTWEFRSSFAKIVFAGESKDKFRLILSVTGLNLLLKNKELAKIIETNFYQVDLPQNLATNVMGIPLNDYNFYSFLQSKDEFPLTPLKFISSDYYERFFPFISFYPRKSDDRFKINLPTEDITGRSLIMNECISIFILMFYMSELVRYNPKTIQENLSKPEGWLMERFVINTPQTFLRYMVNLIVGEDFIFTI